MKYMKSLLFKKIDAFAGDNAFGNPAGVIYLKDKNELSENEMQRIALELKGVVCEVGFVTFGNSHEYDFELRFFSCEREVPFCGHATIAISNDIVKTNPKFKNVQELKIKTGKGILKAINKISLENAVYISAPEPVYHQTDIEIPKLAKALNISGKEILENISLSVVNTGQNILLVPLKSLDDCIKTSPDYLTLRNFCLKNNVEGVNIYTADTYDPAKQYRTRVFAPTFGYLEDPATGSANCSLAYELYRTKLWDGDLLTIEQGLEYKDHNIIKIFFDKTIQRVFFGGSALTRIEGSYLLHSK